MASLPRLEKDRERTKIISLDVMLPDDKERDTSLAAVGRECLIPPYPLLLSWSDHWMVFSTCMPVAAVYLDQCITNFEVDNTVMDLDLLFKFNPIRSKPFCYALLWPAWFTPLSDHSQCKFTTHGWSLLVFAIPSMVALITAKTILVCLYPRFIPLDLPSAISTLIYHRRSSRSSICFNHSGNLTVRRTILRLSTRVFLE
jgi:hypothetical protein